MRIVEWARNWTTDQYVRKCEEDVQKAREDLEWAEKVLAEARRTASTTPKGDTP